MINLIVYIVSTVFTYVLGLISKHFNWNETVPIPVQNICIGLIVFSIVYIIYKPTNYEDIINQIIVAMGGTGTATLVYDTKKIGKEK